MPIAQLSVGQKGPILRDLDGNAHGRPAPVGVSLVQGVLDVRSRRHGVHVLNHPLQIDLSPSNLMGNHHNPTAVFSRTVLNNRNLNHTVLLLRNGVKEARPKLSAPNSTQVMLLNLKSLHARFIV